MALKAISGKHSQLAKILQSYSFNFTSEAELQEAIATVLTQEKISFEREVSLTKADRIDFKLGKVGLEVKIGFSYTEVITQLHRYAQCEELTELVLVTTRWQHTMPEKIGNKKLTTVQMALATSL